MTLGARPFGPVELAWLAKCDRATADFVFQCVCPPELLYRPLSSPEAERAVADIEETLQRTSLRVVGSDDPEVWNRGWAELATRLQGQQVTMATLRPQYFHAGVPCRLFGELVEQISPDFEYWVGLCVRSAIFAEFLRGQKHIVEFGCGTGINLLLLTKLLPEAKLVGCDWAKPSLELLARMAQETGRPIEGYQFNMLTATGECGSVTGETAVLTVHALEQLGPGSQPFLDFLLERRPALCVHVEPLLELYDPAALLDDLARRYHQKRKYLSGFVPAVQALEASGRAEILALRRTGFAGLYHDAYSVLVWRMT